jgi:biotin-(acetyl-CoA carboxylase) ligase
MISIPMIRRQLANDLVGRHIYFFGSGPSASANLRRLAEAGAQEGTVVLSEGDGSTFQASALFRPVLPLAAAPVFASIATLALAEAIAAQGLHATPVWPNQVAVEGDTVATSTVETAQAGDRTAYVILGIDVDVRALEAVTRRWVDPNDVLAAFLNALDRWSAAYAARGPAVVRSAIRFLPRGSSVRALEGQRAG